MEHMKHRSKTVSILDKELEVNKKNIHFLDCDIILNSRFNTFLKSIENIDINNITLGSKYKEIKFKSALLNKARNVNKMRKRVLNSLKDNVIKNKIHSKVHFTDYLYINMLNKDFLNKLFIAVYSVFIFALFLSYINIMSILISGLISILFLPIVIFQIKNIKNINRANFMLSLKKFSSSIFSKYNKEEFTKAEFCGYKEAIKHNTLMPFETRVHLGLQNIYNSQIIIPFIKNKNSNFFYENYGRLQSQQFKLKPARYSRSHFLKNNLTEEASKDLKEEDSRELKSLSMLLEYSELAVKEEEKRLKIKYASIGQVILFEDDFKNPESLKQQLLQSFSGISLRK